MIRAISPTGSGTVSEAVFKQAMISVAVFAGVTGTAWIVRYFLFRLLHRWTQRTSTMLDDLLIAALRHPSIFWCLAIGLYFALGTSSLPAAYVTYSFKAIHVLVILSVTFVLANVSSQLVTASVQRAGIAIPVSGLSQVVIKGVVLTIGFLILLGTLGISVAPLITALGVGGLAVALALQDTLSNLFAGLHILMERSIRVGDFVKLESGQEGRVIDISWRTTRVQMPPNTVVVIPNNKLAQSVVTNYSLPEPRMALLVPVSVGYQSDPDRVERVLVEEATRGVAAIPGLLPDPPPMARLIPGFGESSLDFTLVCQVRSFEDQPLVQHELHKRILRRFRQEGIEMPFPIRTVHLRQDAPRP
jgi:small-conductance mechanosensitive channel